MVTSVAQKFNNFMYLLVKTTDALRHLFMTHDTRSWHPFASEIKFLY